jgi:hypothetical protein
MIIINLFLRLAFVEIAIGSFQKSCLTRGKNS